MNISIRDIATMIRKIELFITIRDEQGESVMKQECSVIVRWRDFIPLILLLIVSLVCQSDRELDDRSY